MKHARLGELEVSRIGLRRHVDDLVLDRDGSETGGFESFNLDSSPADVRLAMEGSLRRLGETMQALDDVVRAGKVRYLGASSMRAWQFAKAQYTADLHGWTRFVSMRNQYSLITREEEREIIPYCREEGIDVTPWSPLARGRLTRAWDAAHDSSRASLDRNRTCLDHQAQEADRAVAKIALSWVAHQPGITAPIVGAAKPRHLTDAVAALDIQLTDEELTRLEAPYVPHLPVVLN